MHPTPSHLESFSGQHTLCLVPFNPLYRRFKMNTTTKTLTALSALALFAGTTHAATIFDDPLNELADPAITASQTPYSSGTGAANVFDDAISNSLGDQYATDGANADAFIDFDFGASTVIAGFAFAQRGGGGVVTDFDLIFSNNSDFSSPVATLNFATSGSPDHTLLSGTSQALQQFEFASSISARYVKWDVNASNNQYDGANEMEFWTVPEPGSLALLGLGGLLIGTRRRRA